MPDVRTRTTPKPQAAPTRPAARPRARVLPDVPAIPTWAERLTPKTVRNTLAHLGLYDLPTPQPPSTHLLQTLAFIDHYGNCKSLDINPLNGRVCIRGAQTALVRAGHATEATRHRAVAYMETTLQAAGCRMQFFAWHDLETTTLDDVRTLMTGASRHARANGE